jgi:hypothetical protein
VEVDAAQRKNMALVLPAIDGFSNGLGWEYSRNCGSGYC